MKVSVVSFDLDKTLIKTVSPAEIIRSFLVKRGIYVETEEILKVLRETSIPKEEAKNPYSYYISINQRLLSEFGLKDRRYAEELLNEWFSPEYYTLFPETVSVLETLKKRKYYLAIISNNLYWEIMRVLQHTGIGKFFNAIFSPDKVRAFKPNPKIFLEVARFFNVDIAQLLHIGNDLREDYFGALNAGARAVLVVRNVDTEYIKRIKKNNIVFVDNLMKIMVLLDG